MLAWFVQPNLVNFSKPHRNASDPRMARTSCSSILNSNETKKRATPHASILNYTLFEYVLCLKFEWHDNTHLASVRHHFFLAPNINYRSGIPAVKEKPK